MFAMEFSCSSTGTRALNGFPGVIELTKKKSELWEIEFDMIVFVSKFMFVSLGTLIGLNVSTQLLENLSVSYHQ